MTQKRRPPSPETARPVRDGLWPQYDPDVMEKYGGQWVVVVGGRIVAWHTDSLLARQRVATEYGIPLDEVYAIAVCRPEQASLYPPA